MRATFPLILQAVSASSTKARDELGSFTEENNLEKGETANPEYLTELGRLEQQLKNVKLASSFVPPTFLVALVSQYDAYLGRLIRVIFHKKTEMLRASKKQVSNI